MNHVVKIVTVVLANIKYGYNKIVFGILNKQLYCKKLSYVVILLITLEQYEYKVNKSDFD